MIDDLYDALYKKAVGYTSEEEVREYSEQDELIKRKVTYKNIPPDTTAAKTYMEIDKSWKKYQGMNEQDLIKEAKKIFKQIKEISIDGNKKD